MNLVFDGPVIEFVKAQLPDCARGFGRCRAIGFERGGQIIAGVVFHNWSPETGVIELSAASSRRDWLTRDRLIEIFAYPMRIGCRIAVARIGENNTRARRIWQSLGATETIIPELRGPGLAECVYVLHLERLMREKLKVDPNGEARQSRAARPTPDGASGA